MFGRGEWEKGDLRKLSLKDAKQLLRKFGMPDPEVWELCVWEGGVGKGGSEET